MGRTVHIYHNKLLIFYGKVVGKSSVHRIDPSWVMGMSHTIHGTNCLFTHLNGWFFRFSWIFRKYIPYHSLDAMPAGCDAIIRYVYTTVVGRPMVTWWPYPPFPGGAPPRRQPAALSGGYRIPKGYVVSADPRISNADPKLLVIPVGKWRLTGSGSHVMEAIQTYTTTFQSTTKKCPRKKLRGFFFWVHSW